jgi:glycosyltransferase involved in cell wall biosynthesis
MCSVSIIIPVYQVEIYILRCLESIVELESKGTMIECLLVDDNSPDKSMDIAYRFIDDYKGNIKFRCFHHEKNRGPSAARNTGIMAATGDFIYFMDSDDQIVPEAIVLMIKYIKKYPEVDLIEANHHFVKDGGIYPGINRVELIKGQREIFGKSYMGKICMCSTNKLLRRQLIINESLFFVEGIYYEDLEWINRLFHVIHSILLIPDVIYIYMYNPSSITNTTFLHPEKSIDSFSYLLEKMLVDRSNEAYVAHKLYIFRYLLQALDIQEKSKTEGVALSRLCKIKRQLFMQVLHDYRLILVVFFLLMFKPFRYLLSFSVVRHSIYSLERIVYVCATSIDWIHPEKG